MGIVPVKDRSEEILAGLDTDLDTLDKEIKRVEREVLMLNIGIGTIIAGGCVGIFVWNFC